MLLGILLATLRSLHGWIAGTSTSEGLIIPAGCGYRREAGVGKEEAATGEPPRQAWSMI